MKENNLKICSECGGNEREQPLLVRSTKIQQRHVKLFISNEFFRVCISSSILAVSLTKSMKTQIKHKFQFKSILLIPCVLSPYECMNVLIIGHDWLTLLFSRKIDSKPEEIKCWTLLFSLLCLLHSFYTCKTGHFNVLISPQPLLAFTNFFLQGNFPNCILIILVYFLTL